MIALIAAAAALSTACDGALCNARALAPVLDKLTVQASPAGRRGRPVHILQIGDSHTAGDAITGGWRELLQARYGFGGRGVLPPGRPYDGYLTRAAQATMSPGWSIGATFGKGSASPRPPIGISGYSLTSTADGASMAISVDASQAFARLTVCAIARPGAGALSIVAGSFASRWELGSATERSECRNFAMAQPQVSATLAVEGGPVTITSWATFRDQGGVALSNLGVSGSQLVHFSRTDDAVVAEELRSYDPDLIVVAFGTNEGFSPKVSPFEYEIVLRNQIGRIRRLAGNVPILLLGAPDALSRRAAMRMNTGGAAAAACGETPASVRPEPVEARGATAGERMSTSPVRTEGGLAGLMDRLRSAGILPSGGEPADPPPLPPPPPPVTTTSPLFPPPGLQAIRDVQRRVARSLDIAFWDWEQAMGGRCTAAQWAKLPTPLMRGDYVHYTSAGGREIARRLQADIDRAGR